MYTTGCALSRYKKNTKHQVKY